MRINEFHREVRNASSRRSIHTKADTDLLQHQTGVTEIDRFLDFIIRTNYDQPKVDVRIEPNAVAGPGFRESQTVVLKVVGRANVGTIVCETGVLSDSSDPLLKSLSYSNIRTAVS